jgi:hypothetical protein
MRSGLTDAAATGAEREVEHVRAAVGSADAAFAATMPKLSELLPAVHADISTWLDEMSKEDWWAGMADAVRADLSEALRAGADAGDSGPQIADRVRVVLGESGRERADRIARTETAGGLNHGHDAVRKVLAAETGIALKKEWLSIIDRTTRPEHVQANGQTVSAGDDFTVGGERAAYPGDRLLSAGNRIHCRCTTVTTGILEAIGLAGAT